MSERCVREVLPSLPFEVPEDGAALDEAMLARAHEFMEELARGLFGSVEVDPALLTWADRSASSQAGPDRRSIEDRLKAAEARFVTLVQQIPAVTFMAVLGEGENDIYISPHIEQLLGYSQEEWLSDPFLWYNRLHPDDRALWNDEFTRGCRNGGPFRAECRFLARDGHTVWVHGEARLIKDELGRPQFLQGVAFDITESKLAQELLLEHAVRRAKIEEELDIARRVQTSLLPAKPSLEGLSISALMLPAEAVGGDYYDVHPAADGGWILIGDVSGHGLDAGLVMLMVQSAAATLCAARPGIAPREMISLVNEVLYANIVDRLRRPEYVTLSVLRYRLDGHCTFAGAHQDILVRRAATGQVERIATRGPWVGIRQDIQALVSDADFQLHDGDIMVLYTDGLIEAMNADYEQFDLTRLCSALENIHDDDPAAIRDQLMAQVTSWMARQDDDITIFVARFSSPELS